MCDDYCSSSGDVFMLASDMVAQVKVLRSVSLADLSVMAPGCGSETFHDALSTMLDTGLVSCRDGRYTYVGGA